MPSGLITFLASTPGKNVIKADCFVITLPTGTVMCVTEGQWDITIPSGTPGWSGATTTFSSVQYGVWTRGSITSAANFGLPDQPMDLTCVAQQGTAYPGLSVGILNAALVGLFEPASVAVYTVYMPINGYGDVSQGVETKWAGFIGKLNDIDRAHMVFACVSPMYLCDTKIPTTLYTANCLNNFCDVNCTHVEADFTITITAKTGSNRGLVIPVTALTQAAGYFTQGVITCTAGANVGLSQSVSSDAGGNLALMAPFLLPVVAGDTFSVIKGCDKTMTTCANTVKADGSTDGINWQLIFRGYPYIPPSSSVIG